jgi:predicted dinucleotide-binding enzyme
MAGISVIGIGNMGTAIATIAARAGADVQLVARDGEKAQTAASELGATAAQVGEVLTGDTVVFAVPFAALDELISVYGPALDGKVVVDITNPLDFSTLDGLVVAADGSAASDLAAKLPASRVVKAFNTNFAGTLASGSVGGERATVLVAGDDADAKQQVIDLVRAGGLQAEDVGGLNRARELESIGLLQISLAAAEKIAWTGGFALAR